MTLSKQLVSIAFAAGMLATPIAQAGSNEAEPSSSNQEMKTKKEPKKMFDKVMKPKSGTKKNKKMFDKVMKPKSGSSPKGRK